MMFIINRIEIQECETEMLLLKSICLYKSDSANDKFQSLAILLTAAGCFSGQQSIILNEMKSLNKEDCESAYKIVLKAEQYLRNEIMYVSFIKNYDAVENYPQLRQKISDKEKDIQILSEKIKEIKTNKGWI